MTFDEYVESHGIDNNTYPYAETGLKTLHRINVSVVVAIVFSCISWLISLAQEYLQTELEGGSLAVSNIYARILDVVIPTSKVIHAISLMIWLLVALLVLMYMVLVVLRWRSWERDILISDHKALSLRAKLIRTMRLHARIHDIEKRYVGKGGQKSLDDQARLAALTRIAKMRVFVNTRQSLEDDTIERRFRIIIDTPFEQKEYDEFMSILKDFERNATRMEKGKVSFGSQILSSDYQVVQYTDAIVVKDKYAYDVVEDNKVAEYFEYTHPLSLYTDHTEENKKRSKLAKRWSNSAANDLDAVLTTIDAGAKRISMTVGAKNVNLTYEMSFKIHDQNSSDRLAEQLDKRFSTKGTTVDYFGDRMSIVLALPSMCSSNADVKSLIIEAFGEPDPEMEKVA